MRAAVIARALHASKSGRGWIARCPVHDDRTPSLSITDRGGKVLVHCFGGCSQAAVVAALRSRGLWPNRERRQRPRADRVQWARRRRAIETDLPAARLWRRAAIALGSGILDSLKEALAQGSTGDGEIASWWGRILRWRRLSDADLVSEYREWRQRQPQMTAGMVAAAKRLEGAVRAAICEYLGISPIPKVAP